MPQRPQLKVLVGPGMKGYYTTYRPRPSASAVRTIISKGKGAMPGFSGLRNAQIDDLIAYLKTLWQGPLVKSTSRKEKETNYEMSKVASVLDPPYAFVCLGTKTMLNKRFNMQFS
jgi:hypothetical protein